MRTILFCMIASLGLMGCESVQYVVEDDVTGLNVTGNF